MLVLLQTMLLLAVAQTACATRSAPRTVGAESSRPLGLDLYRPEPDDNPTVPATVALGRRLFHERRLSRARSLACVDCHRPELAFTDGRIDTLETLVLALIVAELEMDLTIGEAVDRLRGTTPYPTAFRETFGGEVNGADLARALAAYIRTIQAGGSPYDRYVWGDPAALSADAQAGLHLFRGRANCTVCHAGANLTDEQFHNTGVFWGQQPYDAGRVVVTGVSEDTGKFKTPTLREIEHPAPYMHDGSIATLEEVVDFYDRGGNANPYRDRELRPLSLTGEEKEALLNFLRSLSGEIREGLE